MITRARAILPPDWAGRPMEEDLFGWPVIRRFDPPEKDLPAGLTDLSHRPKQALHGPAARAWADLPPGRARWTGRAFVGRLSLDEAVVFDLTGPMEPEPGDFYRTDLTEALVLLAVWGPRSLAVAQGLLAVDLERPDLAGPVCLAAKSHDLRVQAVNLKTPEPGFLLATDRSHGQNLFSSLLAQGRDLGLRPAGVAAFEAWFKIGHSAG